MAWRRLEAREFTVELPYKEGTKAYKSEEHFPHQERLEKAFELALKIDDEGYNVYVCGPRGIGRTRYTLKRIQEVAKNFPTPPDICYVNNFEDPARPKCLLLPAGLGKKLEEGIEEVLDYLKRETFKAFEGKDYEEEVSKLTKEFDAEKEKVFNALTEEAKKYNLMVLFSPQGVKLLPLFKIQTPIPEEELFKDPRIREEYQKNLQEFEPIFREYMRKLRDIDSAFGDALFRLRDKIAENLVNKAFEKLEELFKDQEEVMKYFQFLKKELVKNMHLFIEWEKARGNLMVQSGLNKAMNIFRVNLLVDNSQTKGAPVIYERVPTLKGLFGQINYRAEMGILYADHLSITAGTLHKANGGFLVIDLWEILKNPIIWIILKRALLHKKLHLMGGMMEEIPVPHVGLLPDPVPFKAKVFLIGDPFLYYLLSTYDEEFQELFKIKAEFDPILPLDEETKESFPKIIKKMIEEEKLKEISASGLNELLKYSIYEAGNRKKVRFILEDLKTLLREAHALSKNEEITDEDIRQAYKEKIFRVNLIEEKIREFIKEGKYLIKVEGKRVGQINGLSVISLGDYSFGKPSRITASVYPGSKGVINIEREIDMSGPIHTKGVLTLSSYIFHKYSSDFPLQLSCTLTFEQAYEPVEGDSASCAELLAILSAISQIPLRQDIAITGSIDQFGNIQPVGGIKEKVEGFYKVCKMLKFTGTQGVIIPVQNIDNLLLEDEILEDVEKGNFHLYTIEKVDDAIEILTGINAERFHKKVLSNLKKFYELSKEKAEKKRKTKRKKKS
ncbi:MAG: peptidase S16 [Caldimicrobium thiodismutans]|uniref:endopeptidase La n=1 Tax=Caldimicrobium thiodismutans TaxID=1653476 RepID=A0A2N7PJR3_9BACT|nr:MAG: peptidase S16 [Caldimicrobium thiodismutans]